MAEPPKGRVEVWKIRGHSYDVHIWTIEEWNRLPHEERPAAAMFIGGLGWVDVRPIGDAPPLGSVP